MHLLLPSNKYLPFLPKMNGYSHIIVRPHISRVQVDFDLQWTCFYMRKRIEIEMEMKLQKNL